MGIIKKIIQFVYVCLLTNIHIVTPSQLDDDIETIHGRRVEAILQESNNSNLADQWRNELGLGGNWEDVDYTHGCSADRADWKAPEHLDRMVMMASLWYQDQSDTDLLEKINLAMDHWFSNDFTEDDCMNAGGIEWLKCPCGTPGFWNSNWWYQMILIPRLVGNACLLLKSVLTAPRLDDCRRQTQRSYDRVDGDPNGMREKMTGANLLDVTYVGASLALLTDDQPLLLDALSRSYNEAEYTPGQADGIKEDGSFMQHSGQLLTGSYGSVFIKNMIKTFGETQGTGLEPAPSVQSAFLTLINGSEWLMHWKNESGDPYSPTLLWEYSVIGRSISHKYSDWRGIGFSVSALLDSTTTWSNHDSLKAIADRLLTEGSVNPGPLVGSRYFHISDYLVHRGASYILTLKMFSNRTTNSECHNDQSPYGFHLSDGAVFTYIHGNEYTDVAGGWDWNLIPGTTVDYGATPLSCAQVEHKGQEAFVGGVTMAGAEVGLAVMTYTNPLTGSLRWTKTFFFFPNSYVVQFGAKINSAHPTAPVFTVLDQRHLSGPVYIDKELLTEIKVRKMARTMWHDRVGYEFIHRVNLTVDTTPRVSNWSDIGTSDGNEALRLMAAYYEHSAEEENDALWSYIAYLDVSQTEFEQRTEPKIIKMLTADGVRGATFGELGSVGRIVSLAFLSPGKHVTGLEDIRKVTSDEALLLLFRKKETNSGWSLAVADPSQTLFRATLLVDIEETEPILINVELPSGAWAGSSVIYHI